MISLDSPVVEEHISSNREDPHMTTASGTTKYQIHRYIDSVHVKMKDILKLVQNHFPRYTVCCQNVKNMNFFFVRP